MPTIEITPSQARELAAGRSISIVPPPQPKRYVIQYQSGNVYSVVSAKRPVTGKEFPIGFQNEARVVFAPNQNGRPGDKVTGLCNLVTKVMEV